MLTSSRLMDNSDRSAILNSFFKGAASRFVHLEKISLNFSSWSFAIRVNLLHP